MLKCSVRAMLCITGHRCPASLSPPSVGNTRWSHNPTTYKSIESRRSCKLSNWILQFPRFPCILLYVLTVKFACLSFFFETTFHHNFAKSTRFSVKIMMNNIIEAMNLNGKFKGMYYVLMPRIPMIQTDMPFKVKRLQFLVRLVFVMTNDHQHRVNRYKCAGIAYRKTLCLYLCTYAPDGKTK